MSEFDRTETVETALHYYRGQRSGGSNADVVISEATHKTYLIIRGNAEDKGFIHGVKTALGVDLPLAPCTCNNNQTNALFWLGPTEWLAIITNTPDNSVETTLRSTLAGHVAIADVSGGQTLIKLSGSGVATVLKKSSSFDFQSPGFEPGHCVQTTFAKATALVSKQSDGSFDLVIRRSFADYLASWLLDASAEFGCHIE